MDVETEKIVFLDKAVEVVSGLRVSLYGKRSEDHDQPVRMFRYGERLRFPVKLHPPRNFRNPGAFDHQQYLADQGIVALGSVKTERVELLTGVFGNRAELWRTRVHRSIIEKVRSLWSPAQAGLVDAMVIGEDAFISRDLRVDFQRWNLSRAGGFRHECGHSGICDMLGIAAAAGERPCGKRDHRGASGRICVANRRRRSDLASHADAGPVSRGTIALSREVHAQRDWSGGVGLADRESASSVWAEFSTDFLCVLLIVAVGVPILERTSQPYHRGLMYLDSMRYDLSLTPKVAQFRLDLRMVAGRLEHFIGARLPLPAMAGMLRIGFAGFEILIISAVMQVGLALPMAYYFHRATVVGLPANMLVVPLTGVMMAAAIAAVAAGYVSLALAKAPALIAAVALRAISGTVQEFGGWRVADTRVPTPELVIVLVALGGAALGHRARAEASAAGRGRFGLSDGKRCLDVYRSTTSAVSEWRAGNDSN
ncbi:MAG: hypothetical protein DMG85_13695 [Acidobacteria bacterium]|nr:MAG: hypothetical protein DMG85_13695 [Acidobacteriota bacterium]